MQYTGGRGTDGSIYKVAVHNIPGANRVLSEGRVTESELLEQESIVTKQSRRMFRTRKRRDRVGL